MGKFSFDYQLGVEVFVVSYILYETMTRVAGLWSFCLKKPWVL